MPRPAQTEEQRTEVQRRILAAARDLFDRSGIEAVSMRAVGARVGLTASALYAYFPAKIDLLRALWWEALDDLQSKLQKISEEEPDPVNAIRYMSMAYVEFGLENPARFRVLFMADQGELADELKRQGIVHDAYRLVRARMADAIEQGRFTIRNPDLGTQVLWAGVQGTLNLINSSASFPFVSPSFLADTVIETMLAGLRAKE